MDKHDVIVLGMILGFFVVLIMLPSGNSITPVELNARCPSGVSQIVEAGGEYLVVCRNGEVK